MMVWSECGIVHLDNGSLREASYIIYIVLECCIIPDLELIVARAPYTPCTLMQRERELISNNAKSHNNHTQREFTIKLNIGEEVRTEIA